MVEEQFKPEAKCRYHGECTLYNHDALSLEAELTMCGRSRLVDKDYLPQVPEPKKFRPSERYAFEDPGGTCDAFLRYAEGELISAMRTKLHSFQELFDEYLQKHKHW